MKQFLSFLFVAIFFVSCTRDPNSTNNSPSIEDGTVQYKVNGHLVTVTNGLPYTEIATFSKLVDGGGINPTAYIFDAEKEKNKNELVFAILSDSLLLGNYTYDSTYLKFRIPATVNYNGQLSVLYYSGGLFEYQYNFLLARNLIT